MMHFFQWVEALGFSTWVRESGSLWSYPVILFLHTVGLGFLVGPSVAIGLRILGVAPQLPIGPMERLYPIMWTGFWVNAASGFVLLMADATTKMINWDFYVKLVFIGIAVWMLFLIRPTVFGPSSGMNPGSAREKALALTLLTCWAGAITAGRLMAYLGPVSGAPFLNNKF
jgi:hypothetical protein